MLLFNYLYFSTSFYVLTTNSAFDLTRLPCQNLQSRCIGNMKCEERDTDAATVEAY